MALAAGLADIHQVVVDIADDADRCSALDRDHSHLTGGKTKGRIFSFFCHQLGSVSGGAGHLAAAAGHQLNVVHHGTYRDAGKRKAVAYADFRGSSVHDLHSVGQALGSKDISLLAVSVADQRDVRGAVGIVLDSDNSRRDAVLISLEINQSVLLAVAAALVADGDLALVVAEGVLLHGFQKGLLGCLLGHLCEIRTGHMTS